MAMARCLRARLPSVISFVDSSGFSSPLWSSSSFRTLGLEWISSTLPTFWLYVGSCHPEDAWLLFKSHSAPPSRLSVFAAQAGFQDRVAIQFGTVHGMYEGSY